MSLTEKKYGFRVDSHWVEVLGATKAISPRWSLLVDGKEKDSAKKTGEFSLTADLDGKQLVANIKQHGFGEVQISVNLDGQKILETGGFLA